MAKLYFRYGAMNSGKSTALLQAAYNYEERGQHVFIAKPATDTKGDRLIVSRLGVTREVDFLIAPGASLREEFDRHQLESLEAGVGSISCLLIDEAQFLSPDQVDDALRIALMDNVPVLAYGIRTDFQTVAFPGSARLLEVAHTLEELKTICRCGRKAIFNPRKINGRFVFDGDQVAIDGDSATDTDAGVVSNESSITYESLCGVCYLDESGGRLGATPRH